MPKNAPVPVPAEGAALQWVIDNPAAARDAVRYLNLLLGLQVRVTKSGLSALNQQQSLLVSGEVIQLPLPLFWPAGVPANASTYSDTAGAAYSQTKMQSLMDQVTSLTTKLNLVLDGERAVQTQPGAPS
jgi:hypothetical protein